MAHQLYDFEHRWGERFLIDPAVLVTVRALSEIEGRLKNLSLSGALIEADIVFRLNSLIEISMRLPTPSERETILKAYVIRKCNADVGVEWCDFAPSAVKELLRTIAPQSFRHALWYSGTGVHRIRGAS
jgi:hypothetical protein